MDKSEKFWDKRATEYNENEKKWEDTYNKALENTKKYLNVGDTVLDFGCGSGILTIQLSNLVKEIHALDISSKNIEAAEQRTTGNKIENISYTQTTIFDVRYKKETFDVILAFNVLHLLEDTPKVVRRINELLKPSGLFISETASLGETKSFIRFLMSFLSKIKILPHVDAWKFSELEELISSEGFQIVETEILGQSMQTYFVVAKKL